MEEKVSIKIETIEDGFISVQFFGIRKLNEMTANWRKIGNIVNDSCNNILIYDSMAGEVGIKEICMLIEMLSEYYYYIHNKIAVVFADNLSYKYNTHYFEIFARNLGLNVRHFANKMDAVNWFFQK
jgi:hypothetical protein